MNMLTAQDPLRDFTSIEAHITPEPDTPTDPKQPPPQPPVPDDVPDPVNAPVEEPRLPEPPIRAG